MPNASPSQSFSAHSRWSTRPPEWSRVGFECVGLAVGEVDELRRRVRCPGGFLEVVEARQEHREVVVVDWNCGVRLGDLDGLDSLFAGHRDNSDQERGAAGVDQSEVDVGIAPRNVLEAVDEHGVAGDVEPIEMVAVAAEVEQVPVDRHQQLVDRLLGGVLARHRGHGQSRVTFVHLEGLPGVEGEALVEAQGAELVHRASRGDDGQVLVEFPCGDVVEMVAVVVRQDDQIDGRKVSDLAGRLDFAAGPYTVAEIDVLALVQEGGIGQDRQPAKPNQRGGVTDEIDLAFVKIGWSAAGELYGSHRVVSFVVWLLATATDVLGKGPGGLFVRRRRWISPATRVADVAMRPPGPGNQVSTAAMK